MSAAVLQLNFKLNVSPADWAQTAASLAQAFAEVPGLTWKIWMVDEAEGEAGGIYLFQDDASLQTFLQSPLAAQVKSAPFLRELSVRRFEVMEAVTAKTRGPVPHLAPAPAAG